ncbi:MAG: TonB-dependent receptor domain-containing protein [Gammaproteobacteria bacterium]
MNIRILLAGATVMAVVGGPALASDSANDEADEIIVTATRRPAPAREILQTASVVTQADIRRLAPRDLGSLLSRVSGIDFRDSGGRGSVGGVFVRGASPAQTVILIDGMRSGSATVGASTLEALPVESIDRIEIVKGPLSGLYGADAVGGVIQIFTKQGRKERLTPQVSASYRTDDIQEYTAELSGGNDRGAFHGTFSYEAGQGIDRTTIETGSNNDRDGFDELSFNVSGNYRLTDTLDARVTVLRTDYHSEFDNTFGADTGFDSDGKIENNALKLTWKPLEELRLAFDAGHFVDDVDTPVFFSEITTRRTSFSLQGDYQVTAHHALTAGVEYYDDRVDTLAAFSETSRDNIAGYFQWQGRYDRLSITGSVRHDDNEAYGSDTNGSVALGWAFGDDLALIVSYGTAFRAPSFNDLFFPFAGNPDLNPEESETVEVSLRGRYRGLGWRVSGYHTEVDDLIGFDLATFRSENVAKATLEGVELEFDYVLAAWNLSANLNYLDARNDSTNEYLDDRAEFAANLMAYTTYAGVDFGFDLAAESGRHDNSGFEFDGFAIVGLSLGYDINRFVRLSGRVDNLFDDDYTLNFATATETYRTYGRTGRVTLRLRY